MISKEVHMPENDMVLRVSIYWVAKSIEFDPTLLIQLNIYIYYFIKIYGYTTWENVIIYIKSDFSCLKRSLKTKMEIYYS
jgi:hypothetical protein